jgi:chromosomal replication initiator protein
MPRSSLEDLWPEMIGTLRGELDPGEFNTWIRPLRPLRSSPGELVLSVQNQRVQAYITENYQDRLEGILENLHGVPVSLRYELHNDAGELFPSSSSPVLQLDAEDLPGEPLIPRYRFESFVTGPSNQMAFAAARAVAERPAQNYNPFFIYGGTGLGKTHLLQAIGHQIQDLLPELRVRYITCETYVNDLMKAIRTNTTDYFRVRYRDMVDLLLVDDIQFLGGKERTQIEFFHTFNALHGAGKQIVLSSDRFPREIPNLEDRLRSRFQWGLIADIKPPQVETRIAILKNKAEKDGYSLPDDVAEFIADSITTNVRELESCLVRLELESDLRGIPINIKMAREALKTLIKNRSRKVTPDGIQQGVAARFGITVGDMRSSKRVRSISQPRQIAMYLCRKHTNLSTTELGDRFGGRDHSTVLSAVKKIENQVKQDSEFAATLQDIEREITQ